MPLVSTLDYIIELFEESLQSCCCEPVCAHLSAWIYRPMKFGIIIVNYTTEEFTIETSQARVRLMPNATSIELSLQPNRTQWTNKGTISGPVHIFSVRPRKRHFVRNYHDGMRLELSPGNYHLRRKQSTGKLELIPIDVRQRRLPYGFKVHKLEIQGIYLL